jgi:hypothetical protein
MEQQKHNFHRERPSELDLVYNPSLGAYLVWSAGRGYFEECSQGMPLPLAFLILPIILHRQSKDIATATIKSSGLTLFAAKLGAQQEDLLAVHQRAIALRELSLASISTACATKMAVIESSSASIFSLEVSKLPKAPDAIRKLGAVSEKLGAWFARISPEQIASTLRIEF